MNANELADKLEKDGEGCTCCAYCAGECACDANWAEYHTKEAATMLRQQQAEIEALKKTCLDEITKRVYADQTTKIIEGYWEEAQTEIEALNRFIAERGETGQLIIWKAQEK